MEVPKVNDGYARAPVLGVISIFLSSFGYCDLSMMSCFGYYFCRESSGFGVKFCLHLRTYPSLPSGTSTPGQRMQVQLTII